MRATCSQYGHPHMRSAGARNLLPREAATILKLGHHDARDHTDRRGVEKERENRLG
jgi:hypothetical protein